VLKWIGRMIRSVIEPAIKADLDGLIAHAQKHGAMEAELRIRRILLAEWKYWRDAECDGAFAFGAVGALSNVIAGFDQAAEDYEERIKLRDIPGNCIRKVDAHD